MVGLYVHIPFCRQLCPYCDFAVAVRRDPPHEAYCDALLRELSVRRDELDEPPRSVYFGGGTPGMWSADAMGRFVAAIDTSRSEETTIEVNPADVTDEALSRWADLGITRLSIGVQSFDDTVLRGLRRDHDGANAAVAVERAVQCGRFDVSVDLIYAGSGCDETTIHNDVERLAELGVGHVSAYQLTIEPDTVFGRKAARGTLEVCDDDRIADLSDVVVCALTSAGYQRYEVSSFARSSTARSRHNSGYWLGSPYVGLGMGAHSLRAEGPGAQRRINQRRLKTYLSEPTRALEFEDLDAAQHLGERLFLAARCRLGVRWSELRNRFVEQEPELARAQEVAVQLAARGWLQDPEDEISATAIGLDFADAMAQRFWSAITAI